MTATTCDFWIEDNDLSRVCGDEAVPGTTYCEFHGQVVEEERDRYETCREAFERYCL